MHRLTLPLLALALFLQGAPAQAAGFFLADKRRSVELGEVRILLVWDADKKVQAVTVQPVVSGDAKHFAWVVATPKKPKLDEMPRATFDALAAFTYPEAMEPRSFAGKPEPLPFRFPPPPKVLEVHGAGLAFVSDYWIFEPGHVDKLRDWGRKHGHDEARIEELLVPLLKKGWFLTVSHETTEQFKRNARGIFEKVMYSPLRFSYPAEAPTLPLELTKHNVKEPVRLVVYAAAATKMDLPGELSYQPAWLDKWTRALKSLPAEKRTAAEKDWLAHAEAEAPSWRKSLQKLADEKREPALLRYAQRLTEDDLDVLAGKAPYTREAPIEIVRQMRTLLGHLQSGQVVTKMERALSARELEAAVVLTPARVGAKADETVYRSLLPAP